MSDHNPESHYGENGLTITGVSLPNSSASPLAYDDIIKLSLCKNTQIGHCFIAGGREDCINAVRGEGLTIYETDLEPKGRNGITIKGGFQTYRIEGVHFSTHGSECDIELGQFSIHDRFPFTKDRVKQGAIIESDATGDTDIVVRVWNADVPAVRHSRVRIEKIPWFIWFPYFCFRRLQVIVTGE